jgi:hypothetical protein
MQYTNPPSVGILATTSPVCKQQATSCLSWAAVHTTCDDVVFSLHSALLSSVKESQN